MKRYALLTAALVALWAGPANAGPIAVDAGWYGFCFGNAGSPATAGCQNSGVGTTGNAFTFTALTDVLFKITDAFLVGDRFTVDFDGTTVLDTSVPSGAAGVNTDDPDLAFANARYSSLAFLLGAGAHTVNVTTHTSVAVGGAYLEVESLRGVPEPASLLLLGTGVLGMLARRRRQATQVR